MRILHTADWHFGRQLEGRDRRIEQAAFVDELCRIADERSVDLVLIAGDVYDSVNPPAWAEELFYDALERLSREGTRGVVVIAGNHDQPERVRAAAPLATKLGIVLLGLPKEAPLVPEETSADRVRIVAGGPSWLELAVPGCEHHAVVLALPYPSESRLKELLSASFSQEQMQLAFSERIAELFAELSRHFRDDTVNLVTSHLFVMGGLETDSERPIQIGGAMTVSPQAFPEKADYVALGHLHRLQKLRDKPLVRYSGSPLSYSFSEAGQSKAVVLVDVVPGTEGVREEIVYLTSGRPLARWKATEGIAQVERWLAEGRDAGAWIDLELHVSDVLDPAEFQRLRKLSDDFLKIQRVVVRVERADDEQDERVELAELTPEQLFRRFYERKRGVQPDGRLVAMFERLLAETGGEEQAE